MSKATASVPDFLMGLLYGLALGAVFGHALLRAALDGL
jgi:hypothetical protein